MSYSKPFPQDEYEQRVNAVKRRMQDAGFDLLICQDPASPVKDIVSRVK